MVSLYVHLQGALVLTDHDLYVPALAALRSALEHYVQDHLLFLGNRYKAVVQDVTDDTFAEWQQAIAESREDFKGILDVKRLDHDRVEVVRSGPHYTGGNQGPEAPGLSIYTASCSIATTRSPVEGRHRSSSAGGHTRRMRTTAGRHRQRRHGDGNEFYTERELAVSRSTTAS